MNAMCVGFLFHLHGGRRHVHVFWSPPQGFVRARSESACLVGGWIVFKQFGNVEIVKFGSAVLDNGTIARIDILMGRGLQDLIYC